eukprot:6475094-Amphidinium_carterae.1
MDCAWICRRCGKEYTESACSGLCIEQHCKAVEDQREIALLFIRDISRQELEELRARYQADHVHMEKGPGLFWVGIDRQWRAQARHPSAAQGSTDPTSGLPYAQAEAKQLRAQAGELRAQA